MYLKKKIIIFFWTSLYPGAPPLKPRQQWEIEKRAKKYIFWEPLFCLPYEEYPPLICDFWKSLFSIYEYNLSKMCSFWVIFWRSNLNHQFTVMVTKSVGGLDFLAIWQSFKDPSQIVWIRFSGGAWSQISMITFCACWQGPKNEADLSHRLLGFSEIQKSTKSQFSVVELKICTFLDPSKTQLSRPISAG